MTLSRLKRTSLAAAVSLAVAAALVGCSGGDPPSMTPQPTMAPVEDFAINMQRCLGEKGWEVEVSWDNSIGMSGLPPEQRDQYDADVQVCLAAFGYDEPPRPLTQEEAQDLYDAMLLVAECVRGLGYTVPDPPSKQTYAEWLTTPGGLAKWTPYSGIPMTSRDDRKRAQQECPPPPHPQ